MVRTSHLVFVAAAITSLTGCGQLPGLVADLANGAALSSDPTRALGGKLSPGNADGPVLVKCGGPGMPGEKAIAVGLMVNLDDDLGLTADQQARIKAIHQQNEPKGPPAAPPQTGKAVAKAFLADPVNEAELRAALKADQDADAATPEPDPVKDLVAIREVLTADQRAKLVARLQAQEGPKLVTGGMADAWTAFEKGLNLNAEQRAALEAVKAKLAPPEPPADPRAGMIAFWQTGDTSGLVPPARPALPVDEIVKLALLLDLSQRKALAEHGLPGLGGVAMGVTFTMRADGGEAGMAKVFRADGDGGKGPFFKACGPQPAPDLEGRASCAGAAAVPAL